MSPSCPSIPHPSPTPCPSSSPRPSPPALGSGDGSPLPMCVPAPPGQGRPHGPRALGKPLGGSSGPVTALVLPPGPTALPERRREARVEPTSGAEVALAAAQSRAVRPGSLPLTEATAGDVPQTGPGRPASPPRAEGDAGGADVMGRVLPHGVTYPMLVVGRSDFGGRVWDSRPLPAMGSVAPVRCRAWGRGGTWAPPGRAACATHDVTACTAPGHLGESSVTPAPWQGSRWSRCLPTPPCPPQRADCRGREAASHEKPDAEIPTGPLCARPPPPRA